MMEEAGMGMGRQADAPVNSSWILSQINILQYIDSSFS